MSVPVSRRRGGQQARPVPPWWTAADDAALDLRVHDLVAAFADGGLSLDQRREACEEIVRWRERRVLRARARWLARQQALADRALRRGAR